MTGPGDFRSVFDSVACVFCPDTLECLWDDGKGLDRKYYRSRHWKLYRHRKIAAADYRCEVCGKEFQWGHDEPRCHHRTYDTLGKEVLQDCSVLCGECHGLEHATDIPAVLDLCAELLTGAAG